MGIFVLIVVLLSVGISFGFMLGFMLGFARAMHEAADRIHSTKKPVFSWVAISLGCVFLVVGLVASLYDWHFTRVAQRTNGTVIELLQKTDKGSGDVSYAPTFQFEDTNGSRHTVSSSFYSFPPEFHVGDRVTVLYSKDNPQNASIDSFWQIWGLPSLAGISGSLCLPVGLVVLYWPKITARFKSQKNNAQTV